MKYGTGNQMEKKYKGFVGKGSTGYVCKNAQEVKEV